MQRGGQTQVLMGRFAEKIREKWRSLRQAFLQMDDDKSGTLTVEVALPRLTTASRCALTKSPLPQELGGYLVKFGIITQRELHGGALQNIFRACDPSGDGLIDYDEFGRMLGQQGDSRPIYLGKANQGQVYQSGDRNGGESKAQRDQELRAVGVLTK